MTKVVKCFVNHLLKDLDYDYVSCSCFVENKKECKLLKKNGFQFMVNICMKTLMEQISF